MIEAEVYQHEKLIMSTTYSDPSLSLEQVLVKLETYIVNEQLNTFGECFIRSRFFGITANQNLQNINFDLSVWKSHTYEALKGKI